RSERICSRGTAVDSRTTASLPGTTCQSLSCRVRPSAKVATSEYVRRFSSAWPRYVQRISIAVPQASAVSEAVAVTGIELVCLNCSTGPGGAVVGPPGCAGMEVGGAALTVVL